MGDGIVEFIVEVIDAAQPVFDIAGHFGLQPLGAVNVIAGFFFIEGDVGHAGPEQGGGIIGVFGQHLLIIRNGRAVSFIIEKFISFFQ
jgi:hypothetical protein